MQHISNGLAMDLYLFALGYQIYITKTGELFISRNLLSMCEVQVSVEMKL